MNKQAKQISALVLLCVLWAVSWRINRLPTAVTAAIKAKAARAAQQDSLLQMRFHKVRAEMDGLYHYRIKPTVFDPSGNPFRIPQFMLDEEAAKLEPVNNNSKAVAIEQAPVIDAPAETGELLLRHAMEATRIGGVVSLGDRVEVNVNGELHQEGDVFTVPVKAKLVLLRIKQLTTAFVILALDDPAAGSAETRIRLN
jgi:hypothetical protein